VKHRGNWGSLCLTLLTFLCVGFVPISGASAMFVNLWMPPGQTPRHAGAVRHYCCSAVHRPVKA
jgi:hypothetical protein